MISVKAFQSKSQRMRMISSRSILMFLPFSALTPFSGALSPFGHSLAPWARARATTCSYPSSQDAWPKGTYLLLCWSIFALPKTHYVIPSVLHVWSMLSLTGWDFTCLGEGRRLCQDFTSVSSHSAQALISVVTDPMASTVATCCLSSVPDCHLHPCNQLC